MQNLKIKTKNNEFNLKVENGTLLKDVIKSQNLNFKFTCAGCGICGRCTIVSQQKNK